MFKKKVFWEQHKRFEKILKSVLIAIAGLLILLLLPAVVFKHFENWTLLEGVYFGVMTLTTIGFGDFVPGKFIYLIIWLVSSLVT